MASSTTKWIIGIAFGLFGCMVLGVYLWWHSAGAALVQGVTGTMMDGRRLGKTTTAAVCVDSGVARQSAAVAVQRAKPDTAKPDIAALMAPSVFLQGCLMAAAPSPELCQDVPARTDREGSTQWADDQCKRRKIEDRSCLAVMQGVQLYCQQRARQRG